jgi:hypothetical protein
VHRTRDFLGEKEEKGRKKMKCTFSSLDQAPKERE